MPKTQELPSSLAPEITVFQVWLIFSCETHMNWETGNQAAQKFSEAKPRHELSFIIFF